MHRTDVTFEQWLDESFGRAVTGENYPQFVPTDSWPDPVDDRLVVDYLTRLFEQPEQALRYFSDRQIAACLWELGPGDSHCVYNPQISIDARLRLVGSVATFFRDFFDPRCVPQLSQSKQIDTVPLNGICYMWWEVIVWGWVKDDPDAERIVAADLDVMEAVLRLPNPACKEAALHGLGHLVGHRDRAAEIIAAFIARSTDLDPELLAYARAAHGGCIQ
ncbi:MAG TPA: hypothetical protein VM757_06145 [Sphingomicrobium sp.]|nr:hypothetical protein [Sphingomicrobium sp.]